MQRTIFNAIVFLGFITAAHAQTTANPGTDPLSVPTMPLSSGSALSSETAGTAGNDGWTSGDGQHERNWHPVLAQSASSAGIDRRTAQHLASIGHQLGSSTERALAHLSASDSNDR